MTSPHARRDGEATRQKLLRAALELYTAEGYHGTTTPAIAARAGVAEGTIYRHFSGKEHLLNEVYRAAQRWAAAIVTEPHPPGDPPPARIADRLQRIGRRLLEGAERDPAAARMLFAFRDERHLDEKSREAAREFRDALAQVIAAGKSDGWVRAGPADLWAGVWLAVVAFAAERVTLGEWAADHPQAALALDAAWAAVRTEKAPGHQEAPGK
jgi:AcrR family transcriptional regulator